MRESNANIFIPSSEIRCKSFNRVTSEPYINTEIVGEDEPHSEQNENLVENFGESDANKPQKLLQLQENIVFAAS